MDPHFLQSVAFPIERLSSGTIYEAVGCETCRGTGFHGRTGIYEILVVTERIRQMVVARATTTEIKNAAMQMGMRTLRQDGWSKVLDGITTIEEVLRVSEEDEALSEN